ncbi:hypothetical protein, partial [Gorillibacterium massiliense]|uniref:hypothetical protein n=1 Tax=Gorillibacterium massiliense TaxID=1280390 RepID=UPI0004B27A0A
MSKQYKNEDLKTVVEHEIGDEWNSDGVTKQNGSMAPDLAEMKRLGKDMNRMKTNQTLKSEGLVPDPEQTD